MARDEGRPLATSSLAVGRFAAKKGLLRSPRGRLVASLLPIGQVKNRIDWPNNKSTSPPLLSLRAVKGYVVSDPRH